MDGNDRRRAAAAQLRRPLEQAPGGPRESRGAGAGLDYPASGRSAGERSDVNLKVPIVILDELAESVIRSTGQLDLASGEIFDVRYDVDRPGPLGLPAADEQYEFTCGTLSNDGKDVEFRIDVDVMRARYFVSPSELLELKVRAAKL